jgi:hypothetical protein
MRIRTGVLLAAFAGTIWMPAGVVAQTAPKSVQLAQAATAPEDLPARRRPPTRLRVFPRNDPDGVYPRYYPGRNAVRECTATYVQEFRPSGTVIVPHTICRWRRG